MEKSGELEPIIQNKKGPKIVIVKNKKEKEFVAIKKKLNKRRKKKLEAGLPVEETVHETKGQAKAIQYLKSWHSDRQNWKLKNAGRFGSC